MLYQFLYNFALFARDVWLEKTKFSLDGIIGYPYGTTFEVKNGKMVKIDKTVQMDTEQTGKCLYSFTYHRLNVLYLVCTTLLYCRPTEVMITQICGH